MSQSVMSESLTLRDTKIRNFGVKFQFLKFRKEPVMLSFLVPTEYKSEKSEHPSLQLRENTQEKQQEIAIRNFQI